MSAEGDSLKSDRAVSLAQDMGAQLLTWPVGMSARCSPQDCFSRPVIWLHCCLAGLVVFLLGDDPWSCFVSLQCKHRPVCWPWGMSTRGGSWGCFLGLGHGHIARWSGWEHHFLGEAHGALSQVWDRGARLLGSSGACLLPADCFSGHYCRCRAIGQTRNVSAGDCFLDPECWCVATLPAWGLRGLSCSGKDTQWFGWLESRLVLEDAIWIVDTGYGGWVPPYGPLVLPITTGASSLPSCTLELSARHSSQILCLFIALILSCRRGVPDFCSQSFC